MFVSRFRKFEPGAVVPGANGVLDVASAHGGPGACLSADDFALAQLFDGAHDAQRICARAQAELGRAITRSRLEGFASELAIAGLLRAGHDEALPVPAHSENEARARGWLGAGTDRVDHADPQVPPQALPGSRSGPGLTGALTGLQGARRGQAPRPARMLDPAPFVRVGRLLLWPLMHRAALLAFLVLIAGALTLAFQHRLEWIAHLESSFGGARLLAGTLLGALLLNLSATAARSAAIWRYTPEAPRVGVLLRGFGVLRVPSLFVDTAGAAERAERTTRLRIVGAGLVGFGFVFLLAVLLWFLSAQTQPVIARLAVIVALASVIGTLLRLNPLARFDGYHLLCNALDNLDLRHDAAIALAGRDRPWKTQRGLSRTNLALYALAVIAFMLALGTVLVVFVGGWLVERFSGTGFLIMLAVSGVYMQKQYIQSGAARSDLGWPKKPRNWRPTGRQLKIAGIVALIALVPYPYAPSGDFEVLPRQRADVRALIAGDVRQVLVQEGEVVKAGQPIAKLDESAARSRVAAAEAELARFQAELALVRKGTRSEELEIARQRVLTAKSAADLARSQARRIEQAYKGKSVTPQEYDRARGAADVAQQQLLEAQRALDLAESPAQDERIAALEAEVRRVEADLSRLRQELAYTTVKAPIDGRVVSPQLQFSIGQYLDRGALLAVIEDTGELLAEIRLPESVIGEIAPDAEASAKPWAYPGSRFEGQVRSIAPAAENGEYGRIVRVQMVVQDPDNRLKTGMTGNAKVDAGWQPLIVVFTKALVRFLMVEVWSWIP